MNIYHALGVPQHSYGHTPPPANHPLLLSSPFSHEKLTAPALPLTVDLQPNCLPVRNQMDIGECSAFSAAAFRELLHWKATGQVLPGYLSPPYLYWRTRLAMGLFPSDCGASIASEFGTLQVYGVCPESFLPFQDVADQVGTPACDTAAAQFRIGQPLKVDCSDMTNIETVLANGLAINIGFTVYQSFESTGPDGLVPPIAANDPILGGHGVVVIGYDHTTQLVKIRNQWGQDWADKGYCYMTYSYFQNVVSEAWTAAAVA